MPEDIVERLRRYLWDEPFRELAREAADEIMLLRVKLASLKGMIEEKEEEDA